MSVMAARQAGSSAKVMSTAWPTVLSVLSAVSSGGVSGAAVLTNSILTILEIEVAPLTAGPTSRSGQLLSVSGMGAPSSVLATM